MARVVGSVPSRLGVEPARPRTAYCPEVRSIMDLPPPERPGWKKSRLWRSLGDCSRMKSSVSTSTVAGNSSGGAAKKVAVPTRSAR